MSLHYLLKQGPSLPPGELTMIFSTSWQQILSFLLNVSLTLALTFSGKAQVHYLGNGSPWSRKAETVPMPKLEDGTTIWALQEFVFN